MKIAILADPIDNQNAGIHVFTREMVNALILSNPGHEIILVREKFDASLKGVSQIVLPNIRLPIGYASFRLFFSIPVILRVKKVDVVVEPAHFGPFNLPAKVKRVTVIHDLTPILFPHLHRWHSQLLQKIFLKNILKNTNIIISNSENTSRDICNVYPESCSKVRRIYPGKGKHFFPTYNEEILRKYNITQPYFLFTGTIEPRKNLTTLLDAFRIFISKSKNSYQLIIAGGIGWKSEKFSQALAVHPHRDKIICTGFVPEDHLPVLYSHALAFIYPSMYEGFGLPVIEAMACGTPVIVAKNSALIEAGGKAALYFNTNDAVDLADKMNEITENDSFRRELSGKGLAHVNQFNWDTFAKSFWNLLGKN